MNEGKFPAGKSQNSFIPYDVKRIRFAYIQRERRHLHLSFYHLLQRAKTSICFITLKVKLDAGEKSRFITQLEVEKQAKHTITHEIYNAVLPKQPINQWLLRNQNDVAFKGNC
jgi:hypothetical protein